MASDTSLNVLVVEDEPLMQANLCEILAEFGWEVELASTRAEALAAAGRRTPDLVLLDIKLPDGSGLDLLRRWHEERRRGRTHALPGPVLVLTAFGDSAHAIEAMRLGAFDYITKPFRLEDLYGKLKLAARRYRETKRLAAAPEPSAEASPIVGESPAMQDVFKQIGRVAAADVPVLVLGETGTGKELVARAIHRYSARSAGPFVALNCAALPPTLLESELFGYEQGAFTGADTRRIGLLEQASGGTLFLDEVGDLDAAAQAKLLRALQEGVFLRVGGREPVSVDVRIIAATHRDLDAAVEERRFRADLLFRLNVVRIAVPPLRERTDDVPMLARHFVRRYGGPHHPGLTDEALDRLTRYDWPGNVRELENVIRHALLMAQDQAIDVAALPASIRAANQTREALPAIPLGKGFSLRDYLDAIERAAIEEALRQTDGVKTRAADLLGIHRRLLYEKLQRYREKDAQKQDDGEA